MSTEQTVILAALAGFTIYLGLPLGRVKTGPSLKIFLNGFSAGVLIFLFFDIMSHATQVLEATLLGAKAGKTTWVHFSGIALIYVLGLGVGLLSLLFVQRLWKRKSASAERPVGVGPGAMAVAEVTQRRTDALRLGMSIAVAIGLHNFSEGLAIGQAGHTGELTLAVLLVVGFALHNATEGFGIVGPLVGAGVTPTWGWLALAGLVGGGPTFIGALVGSSVTSEIVFVGCLTLAAGAIIYVLGELFSAGRKMSWEITLWGILAGLILGLATDMILVAAGA